MHPFARFAFLFTVSCGCLCASPALADDADDFFETSIRPVLAAHCAECHGDEQPEAGLRLTSRADVLTGGASGPAAVEGHAADSLLFQAVSQTGDLKMPPEGKLRDDQIAALRQWIELGLPWPADAATATKRTGEMIVTDADRQHWSFQPITDPPLPAVAAAAGDAARDADWPQTSIDAFILEKLAAAGLRPAPRADRRALIRRAYYDLIGLPPTWDEVQAFVADPAPDAWQRVIDRLLDSPRYGERWGRHWMDVARYADTKDGVLMYGDDRIRPYAYTYRDYVIRALNEDVPYDQFIREQLAADLIQPPVEPWRLAAMGYLTLGRMYDNNIHDIIDDQIDVVSRGFLGLTVSCARCHDHKYDPIPTADYYSLYGVFASSEAPLELPLTCQPDEVAGGPEFEAQAAPKRAELRTMLDQQYDLLTETARQRTADYLVKTATTPADPLETAIFFYSLAPEDLRPQITGRWRRLVERRATPDDPVFGPWHDLLSAAAGGMDGAATREEQSDDMGDSGGMGGAATREDQYAAILQQWQTRPDGQDAGQLNPLVRQALAAATLDGPAAVARAYGDLLWRVYEESKQSAGAAGTASPPADAAARAQLLALLVGPDSPAWFPKNQTRKYMSRTETDQFGGKMQELDRLAVTTPGAPPRAMVLNDATTPQDPCIFTRGNPSQRGRPVPRQFLAIVSPAQRSPFGGGSGRLDLADAIVAPGNPLTARVIVNRVWMHHLGEPLVSTPSDFGTRSTAPVHPELLDHLATEFVRDGWSLKALHRRIMLSSVYQQTSAVTPQAAAAGRAIDPENRLLWRAHRRRLDFEAMRDTLLALSGRLQHRGAGRPTDVAGDPLNSFRTIYGLVDRQSLPGLFRAFDFATPDQSIERRPRTMVPQQALFALNAPFVAQQARDLAARPDVAAATEPADRAAALYRAVFARQPTPDESAACLEFVSTSSDPASQLSAWEQLAQVLLASNEVMYLD
jgi:hypothetical protein